SSALAARVREQQDLTRQWEELDKAVIVATSEPPGKREEGRIADLRRQLSAAGEKLAAANLLLEKEFPNYAELTSPKPLNLVDAQRLISAEEALIVFLPSSEEETFVWAISRESHSWQRIPLGDKSLAAKIATLRKGVDL